MKQIDQVEVKVGQQFPLTIKKIGINGEGIGFFKRKIVFVDGAIPGEVITAEVTKVSSKMIDGKIKRIREKSPARQTPPCLVYETCGGCHLQHIDSKEHLNYKRQIVIDALERYTDLNEQNTKIHHTIGMENPWAYRNKSQLQFGEKNKQVVLGLYEPNSHRLVELTHCHIHHPLLNEINLTIANLVQKYKISIYDEKKDTGLLRTAVVRVSTTTNEVQVTLVSTWDQIPNLSEFTKELVEKHPQVVSVFINMNEEKTSTIFGHATIKTYGKETITQGLGKLEFDLSPRSFFQLNPKQTEVLYDVVKEVAGLTGNENVVDAYCGVGSIGLWVSEDAKELRGMDVIPEAVEDANHNARKNGKQNVTYVEGNAGEWVSKWKKEKWPMDVFIVDPPRTGSDQEFIRTIIESNAKKVVYVSCNPSTLAKDINTLGKKYKVVSIQPVDLFPQTAHVETVALIERK